LKAATTVEAFRSRFYRETAGNSDNPKLQQQAFRRACRDLQDRGFMGVFDNWLWLIG
jgi:hypothetical protein